MKKEVGLDGAKDVEIIMSQSLRKEKFAPIALRLEPSLKEVCRVRK